MSSSGQHDDADDHRAHGLQSMLFSSEPEEETSPLLPPPAHADPPHRRHRPPAQGQASLRVLSRNTALVALLCAVACGSKLHKCFAVTAFSVPTLPAATWSPSPQAVHGGGGASESGEWWDGLGGGDGQAGFATGVAQWADGMWVVSSVRLVGVASTAKTLWSMLLVLSEDLLFCALLLLLLSLPAHALRSPSPLPPALWPSYLAIAHALCSLFFVVTVLDLLLFVCTGAPLTLALCTELVWQPVLLVDLCELQRAALPLVLAGGLVAMVAYNLLACKVGEWVETAPLGAHEPPQQAHETQGSPQGRRLVQAMVLGASCALAWRLTCDAVFFPMYQDHIAVLPWQPPNNSAGNTTRGTLPSHKPIALSMCGAAALQGLQSNCVVDLLRELTYHPATDRGLDVGVLLDAQRATLGSAGNSSEGDALAGTSRKNDPLRLSAMQASLSEEDTDLAPSSAPARDIVLFVVEGVRADTVDLSFFNRTPESPPLSSRARGPEPPAPALWALMQHPSTLTFPSAHPATLDSRKSLLEALCGVHPEPSSSLHDTLAIDQRILNHCLPSLLRALLGYYTIFASPCGRGWTGEGSARSGVNVAQGLQFDEVMDGWDMRGQGRAGEAGEEAAARLIAERVRQVKADGAVHNRGQGEGGGKGEGEGGGGASPGRPVFLVVSSCASHVPFVLSSFHRIAHPNHTAPWQGAGGRATRTEGGGGEGRVGDAFEEAYPAPFSAYLSTVRATDTFFRHLASRLGIETATGGSEAPQATRRSASRRRSEAAAPAQGGALANVGLVVVFGDQGQGFGAHQHTGEGACVFDECARVPLMVHTPHDSLVNTLALRRCEAARGGDGLEVVAGGTLGTDLSWECLWGGHCGVKGWGANVGGFRSLMDVHTTVVEAVGIELANPSLLHAGKSLLSGCGHEAAFVFSVVNPNTFAVHVRQEVGLPRPLPQQPPRQGQGQQRQGQQGALVAVGDDSPHQQQDNAPTISTTHEPSPRHAVEAVFDIHTGVFVYDLTAHPLEDAPRTAVSPLLVNTWHLQALEHRARIRTAYAVMGGGEGKGERLDRLALLARGEGRWRGAGTGRRAGKGGENSKGWGWTWTTDGETRYGKEMFG